MLPRFLALCAHRRTPLVAALLGMALSLPALGNGLAIDDHLHRLVLQGRSGLPAISPHAWDLFAFAPEDARDRQQMLEFGIGPWWVCPTIRIRFFRPLSAVTHLLDHGLWPETPWLMHLHSLLWYGGLILVVGLFFRRILGAEGAVAAGLATLLYAVDDGHSWPIGWLANRNALISSLLGLGAVLLHVRWRQEGSRQAAVSAPLLLGLALCAGEGAASAPAFVLAHALTLDPARGLRRLLPVLPSAVVFALFLGLYRLGGFGAACSGLYIEPAQAPLRFLGAALERAPVLLASGLALPFADLHGAVPAGLHAGLAVLCAAIVLGICAVALPLLRQDPRARFFLLGSALAVLPGCATFPHSRLLLLAGVGLFGFVALVIVRATEERGRALGLLAAAFAVGHGVLSPLLLPLAVTVPGRLGSAVIRANATLPDEPALATGTLLVLNAPDMFLCSFLPYWRASIGGVLPARTRCLGVSQGPVELTRIDEHTLELAASPRGFLDGPLGSLARPRELPFRPGDVVAVAGWTVTVLQVTADGRPLVVRHAFTRALDEPGFYPVAWGQDGFSRVPLPPPGGAVTLPGVDFAGAFLRD